MKFLIVLNDPPYGTERSRSSAAGACSCAGPAWTRAA